MRWLREHASIMLGQRPLATNPSRSMLNIMSKTFKAEDAVLCVICICVHQLCCHSSLCGACPATHGYVHACTAAARARKQLESALEVW